ncbi:MAG: methylmalonyl-CoA epimerase [Desulfohalobiaceae bacterium]|nr:methylmalonyl-CoA epimerase [Desulfohalobiaceae bacterium]
MLQKIDHLGIAVKSLDEAVAHYENVMGVPCEKKEVIESQKVRTAFFAVGDTHIELLEPTSDDSPIAKFLEKNGEGLHHVAYYTDHLEEQLKQAEEAGCRLINREPVPGAGGKRIAFLHPKSTYGVLTEFCTKDE